MAEFRILKEGEKDHMLNFGKTVTLSSILLTTLSAGCGGADGTSQDGSETEIVQGRTVTSASATYPVSTSTVALATRWMARAGKSFCSGTLIGPNTVLTAAHCLQGSPSGIVVVFSSRVTANSYMLPVTATVVHPGYNNALTIRPERMWRPAHDIAIVRFRGKVPSTHRIIPVGTLGGTAVTQSARVTLAGFGRSGAIQERTQRDVNDTGVLRTVDVGVVSVASRGKVFAVRGFDRNRLQGACSGDSGGPTYISRNGRWYVIGALSTGVMGKVDRNGNRLSDLGCIGTNTYTDARHYADWIAAQQRRLAR